MSYKYQFSLRKGNVARTCQTFQILQISVGKKEVSGGLLYGPLLGVWLC